MLITLMSKSLRLTDLSSALRDVRAVRGGLAGPWALLGVLRPCGGVERLLGSQSPVGFGELAGILQAGISHRSAAVPVCGLWLGELVCTSQGMLLPLTWGILGWSSGGASVSADFTGPLGPVWPLALLPNFFFKRFPCAERAARPPQWRGRSCAVPRKSRRIPQPLHQMALEKG